MTLNDCLEYSGGKIVGIGGDPDIRCRLADLGLVGSEYTVRAKRRHSVLVDFIGFSAVLESDIAADIEVIERLK